MPISVSDFFYSLAKLRFRTVIDSLYLTKFRIKTLVVSQTCLLYKILLSNPTWITANFFEHDKPSVNHRTIVITIEKPIELQSCFVYFFLDHYTSILLFMAVFSE